MGVVATFVGDVVVTGALVGMTSFAHPAGSIGNVDVSASAAIAASKLQRSLRHSVFQDGTAADKTYIAFFCKSAVTFKHFTVSNLTPNAGSSTVTVDVQKNGVTILSAVVTLDNGDAAYSELEGTITTTTAADGDYITIVIDAVQSGTDALATGVFAQLDYDEVYTP